MLGLLRPRCGRVTVAGLSTAPPHARKQELPGAHAKKILGQEFGPQPFASLIPVKLLRTVSQALKAEWKRGLHSLPGASAFSLLNYQFLPPFAGPAEVPSAKMR